MATGGDMGDLYKPAALNSKRSRFLSNLPAEHQNLFVSGDRFTVQNAGCVTGKGIKPYERINFRPQTSTTIDVCSYEGRGPITYKTRCCICAYALSLLYDRGWEGDHDPSYPGTLGPLITILSTFTSYDNLKYSGLETNLTHCHIKVEHTKWKTLEEVYTATKDLREAVAKEMKVDDFESTPQVFQIVALSTLILIGKNISEANRDGWFRNRWRALAHVANMAMDVDRIDPPLLRPCQAVYTTCSANQPIRSFLFRVMRSFASTVDDQNHVIFDRIIRLLQWSEMSHVWMIMEYVYSQNPDILNFPQLSGPELASMTVAINFLKKYPKEERAYLKLLHDHNELMPLHSNNFTYFTAAAHAITAMTKASMLNINTRFSEGVKEFQGKVVDYIRAKNKIGPLASGVSFSSTLHPRVQQALYKSIEDTEAVGEIPDFIDRQPEARE